MYYIICWRGWHQGVTLFFVIHKNGLLYLDKRDSMIYIANTTTQQEVYIPSAASKAAGTLTFSLYSTVNRETLLTSTVTDLNDTELYYHIEITLGAAIEEGEYQYTLTAGNAQIAAGLAMVSTDSAAPSEYNTTTVYEQYEC